MEGASTLANELEEVIWRKEGGLTDFMLVLLETEGEHATGLPKEIGDGVADRDNLQLRPVSQFGQEEFSPDDGEKELKSPGLLTIRRATRHPTPISTATRKRTCTLLL